LALNDHDEARIRDYLLGHLNEEEQEKIEGRLMTEDDLFDELEVSKGELIEEYCAGELSRNEHKWFEQHYLASKDGRRTHAVAVALNSVTCPIPAPRKLTWLDRLKDFLNAHRWAVAAAASAALLIILATPFIFRRTPSTSYAFALHSTVSQRSSGDARYFKVPLSADIGELRITLQLPQGVTRGTDYRVELDDRGATKSLKAASHDANSVVVAIPAASLREDLYALRLYAVKTDGTEQLVPGEYLFELVNPARFPSTPKQ
jgi:hypothetical protein